MAETIFITGATGFIGAHLAQRLLEQGHRLKALCRQTSETSHLRHPHVELVQTDLLEPDRLVQAMKGCTQAYHLAALAKANVKDPQQYYNINVTGTMNVLKAARTAGVKRVVLTSTGGVAGPSHGVPVDEEMPRREGFFTAYESSKWLAEEEARAFAAQGHPEVVICSPCRVYGPGFLNDSNAATLLIKRYLEGTWRFLPGNGDGSGSYVFVEDVAKGLLLAMEHGRNGEKYYLGGENVTYRDFFEAIAEAAGEARKEFMVPVPINVMVGAVWAQQKVAEAIGSQPKLTPRWARKYSYDWAVSSAKAANELNYHPQSLREGLTKTIAWLRSEA